MDPLNAFRSFRTVIVAFGFLACIHVVHSQPTFIRTYTVPFGVDPNGVAPAGDGGLVIAGTIDSLGCLLRLNRNGDQMWMKRYNAIGNGIWGGFYPFHENQFLCVAVMPNGRIMVGGMAIGGSFHDRSVMCFDSLGTLIWGQTSGDAVHADYLSYATTCSGNTVIMAGANSDLLGAHAAIYRFTADTTGVLGGARFYGPIITQPSGAGISTSFLGIL